MKSDLPGCRMAYKEGLPSPLRRHVEHGPSVEAVTSIVTCSVILKLTVSAVLFIRRGPKDWPCSRSAETENHYHCAFSETSRNSGKKELQRDPNCVFAHCELHRGRVSSEPSATLQPGAQRKKAANDFCAIDMRISPRSPVKHDPRLLSMRTLTMACGRKPCDAALVCALQEA